MRVSLTKRHPALRAVLRMVAVVVAGVALSLIVGADSRRAYALTIVVNDDTDVAGACPATCTLRAAITLANANSGSTINFSIAPAGLHVISIGSDLPAITVPTTIDGTTQAGYSATPVIAIDGGSTVTETYGLWLALGGSTVKGLNIRAMNGHGIQMSGVSGNTLTGNFIGTDFSGLVPVPNSGYGIGTVIGGNTIGGSAPGARNVISGNALYGVGLASSGNVVQGNYIGLGADGSTALANSLGGVGMSAGPNTIGGTQPSERNVISSNGGYGINMINPSPANVITGNYIGVAADGMTARANTGDGISVTGAGAGNIIGRTTSGAGNIIANNGGVGIKVDACSTSASATEIRGNSIYSNSGGGISLLCGANGGIAAPTIVAATYPPQGTTCGNCWVDVYSDTAGEGRTYHGSTQATAGGAWAYSDRVDGPNVTAVATDGAGNSSAFSGTLARPACTAVCTEGLWQFQYTGAATHNCTTWNNQVGATIGWGHASCTDSYEFNFTSTLSGGSVTTMTTSVNPPGLASTATGTYTAGTASGTWFCTLVCVDSGPWMGTRYADTITIPAGGGQGIFVPGVPSATVDAPAGSPAITVYAVPLQNITSDVVRTGYDFLPHGFSCAVADPCTPIQLTVNYVAATDLPPAPFVCQDLAQYKYDPLSGLSTFESRIACNTALSMFTTPIRSFSVHRFEVGRDTDGDLIDDGPDVCPLVIDGGQAHSDAHILDYGPLKSYDDWTSPWGDDNGDACDGDGDRDNDGLSDLQELAGCGFGPTSITLRDTDGDLFIDKAECQLGTNPNLVSNKPLPAACGSTLDADLDGISTAREFCYYGTDPNNPNSDAQHDNISPDTCTDGQEAASVNGDFLVSSTDLSQVAQQFGPYTLPANLVKVTFDITKNGTIDATDLSQVAQRFTAVKCQSLPAPP